MAVALRSGVAERNESAELQGYSHVNEGRGPAVNANDFKDDPGDA